ncbi:related to CAP1-Cryptococcus gattii [Serendipita indica DSM 11827]|uniref:Related to CAP1-Cryptococcus gattii n=1 Tax=Serendipita indica (strain DSM 11827) TaxID=1109443 RepID=G4T8S9_SERID|nr:related to CAP1-Cryptococcus gattii [Serendipita indica DSM 11827]
MLALLLGRGIKRLCVTITFITGLLLFYNRPRGSNIDLLSRSNGDSSQPRSGFSLPRFLPSFKQGRDQKPIRYPVHPRLRNGLIDTNMSGRHPVADLIDRGERTWKARLERQSKTLEMAVEEYKRRYKRLPPKGFDDWWRFAKENRVVLIDEFDALFRNVEPYFALSPRLFNSRVERLSKELSFSFSITVKNGTLTLGGERARYSRAQDIRDLLEPVAQWLPDLELYASDHDKGNIILGKDQYDMALELANDESYFTEPQLKHYEDRNRNSQRNLRSACHPFSNAIMNPKPDANSSHTFLAHPLASFDYCSDPSLIKLHGSFAFDHTHESRLEPMWVHCKWAQDFSFLLPALPGFEDIIRDPLNVVPWSQRRDTRLFWRARSTGVDFHTGWNWKAAHRIRLHFHAKDKAGQVELLQEVNDVFLEDRPWKKGSHELLLRDQVSWKTRAQVCNEPPPFCENISKEVEFLQVVPQSRGQDAKYVIDIDGNGWSQRYARLLSSGSVVFKSTIFPEWNTEWLVPFYHYIPVKVDYSDIFDLMSFFTGWPDGTPGHDELAEKIAMNAVNFVRDHWRIEDMQAYMFRFLLEYARLASPDRDAASYRD